MNTLLRTENQEDIAIVWLDAADRPVNVMSPAFLEELAAILTALEKEKPAGIVFASAKADVFCNGADLFSIKDMDRAALVKFIGDGQRMMDRIAALPVPTVAAINGHCLGGGMELALACNYRVAADRGTMNIGLPETKLGILPAWGGTTRLPRRIGLTRALPIILAGKTMPPRKALSAGLVDEVVRPEALLSAAKRMVRTRPAEHKPGKIDRIIAAIAPLRSSVLKKARAQTLAQTFGNYPAPERVIEVVRAGFGSIAAGLAAEREAIGDLIETPAARNLLRIFFLRQGAKKAGRKLVAAEPRKVRQVAVIGGGTMGAGIAHAMLLSGLPVRLIEADPRSASAALGRVRGLLDDDVKAKRLSPLEGRQAMNRLSPATDYSGLKLADFVIEAVLERMSLKREVFAKLDAATRPDAVLASNTSSLSIAELAATTVNPSRVIGLHFFNPVPKMPLVEVVRAPGSDPVAVATGMELGNRLGKVTVLAGDGPGFIVNRVLIPYFAEALHMAAEGVDIAAVDLAMKRWGMPMGPFELLDQVGLDVGVDIFRSVGGRLIGGIAAPPGFEAVTKRGWLGKKSGRGFYIYEGKETRVNTELLDLIRSPVRAAASLGEEAIQQRLLRPMIDEAHHLLAEGVADSADTIDLATVMGLGLAPFRGGLMTYAGV